MLQAHALFTQDTANIFPLTARAQAYLAAAQNFSPNIPQVTILPALPARLIRLLDIQPVLSG